MPSSSSPPKEAAAQPAGAASVVERPDIKAPREKTSPWGRMPVVLRRTLLLIALIAIWQIYYSASGVSELVFASPAQVAKAFWEGWTSGDLASATLLTLKILALGMLIGAALAAVLTTLATWTRIGDDVLTLLTSMLNPLPSIAILPLAILWFGLSQTALVIVIANAVTWPIAINLSTGFRTVNSTILAVGRNIGLHGWKLVRDVLLPSALPHTISGLKTGWAFGWRTIIAAELVFGVAGGGGGLGNFINRARYFLQIPEVFAGLLTIALIGVVFDWIFTLVERRTVVRWGMKTST